VSDYTQTEEFAEMVAYMTEEIGVEHREAKVSLRDGDLWPLIDAGSMHPFEGEEAVEMWADAVDHLSRLIEFHEFGNPALVQTFYEGVIRAEEMLKRAKARVREASTE
jgi:hypothetical protein